MHKNITPENPTCASCETFLPQCSYVIQDFYLWLVKNYPDMHIDAGFRSQSDQHADFLSGKSELDFPRSAHNHLNNGVPFSEAIDIFVLNNGVAEFPVSRYQDVYSAAMMAAQPIEWGGQWKSLKDWDHFQNSGWQCPPVQYSPLSSTNTSGSDTSTLV